MLLFGIPLLSDDVFWLADEVSQLGFVETASKLLHAEARGIDAVQLTSEECEALLTVLDDPPFRYAELREALLAYAAQPAAVRGAARPAA
jgi:hypothetical protein